MATGKGHLERVGHVSIPAFFEDPAVSFDDHADEVELRHFGVDDSNLVPDEAEEEVAFGGRKTMTATADLELSDVGRTTSPLGSRVGRTHPS